MVQEHEHEGHIEGEHADHEVHGEHENVGQEEVAEKLEEEQEKGYRGEVPDHRDYTMRNAGVPPDEDDEAEEDDH